jgi:glutaredoxin
MKIPKKIIIISALIILGLTAIAVTQNKSRSNLTESAQTEKTLIAQGERSTENLAATSAGETQSELSEADRVLAATDEIEEETTINVTPTAKPTPATAIQTQQHTFFYGATCSFCVEVEEWLEDNKIETKLNILKKEVSRNQDNYQQLTLAAQSCGRDLKQVSVPLLYTSGKECIVGAPLIIEYLAEQAGVAIE